MYRNGAGTGTILLHRPEEQIRQDRYPVMNALDAAEHGTGQLPNAAAYIEVLAVQIIRVMETTTSASVLCAGRKL